MKTFFKKTFLVAITTLILFIVFGLISYFIQREILKSKEDGVVVNTPQDPQEVLANPLVPTQTTKVTREDDDVYKQRQLRADAIAGRTIVADTPPTNETSSNKIYRVGGAMITLDNGVVVSTKFYNLGNVVKDHYGYSEYRPSSASNGIYADVVFDLENTTKSPVGLNINTIRFVDQLGRNFLPIEKEGTCGIEDKVIPTTINELLVSGFSKGVDEITGTLNPNIPCSLRILFEVATSSTPRYIEFLSN